MNYPIPFGKYLLLQRINVGGMAEVFKAKAFGVEGFERILAVKRILPNMADDDEFINMFVDEARIAVQLGHTNIVQIYELGKFEGQYYIAMEYVPGKDLREIFDFFKNNNKLLPIPAAAYITSRICDGLDYAHRKCDPTGRPMNIIHRDVSPQNILMGFEGAVKITDFGIAKAEDRASKTQAGVLKGKFGYMSPEQVRGQEIDRRSDIFALGILMYEMLTGQRLFLGESDFSTLEKVRNAEVEPPSKYNPAINSDLENVLLKTLAKERDDRYQWASELHDDLQQFLIEDATIFNTKKLAALMQAEYQTEIEAENRRMEEFMRLPPPSSPEALAGAEEMRGAAHKGTSGVYDANEKTLIFESEFHGSNISAPNFSPERSKAAEDRAVLGPTGSIHEQLGETGSDSQMGEPSPNFAHNIDLFLWRLLQNKKLGKIFLIGAACLSILILFAVFSGTPEVGALIVTSSPVEVLDISLDGEMIAHKTPISKSDIPLGQHKLEAQAPGFPLWTKNFEMDKDRPAVIHIELDTFSPKSQVNDGVLTVLSEPSGAALRIDGVLVGTTPVILKDQDRTKPLYLEISKGGFQTETQTITFPADSAETKYEAKLAPDQNTSLSAGRKGSNRNKKVKETPAKKAKSVGPGSTKPGQCTGSGGKLSVSAMKEADCRVTVGKTNLGIAPFIKKDSPVGRCEINVACPNGKKYRTIRTITSGSESKIIIQNNDWK